MFDDFIAPLRREAQQMIGRNAVALAPHGFGPQTKAPTPPERQWWNFGAKKAAGERIAEEERVRSIKDAKAAGLPDAHNNAFDAVRHARWSERMASEIGPIFAGAAGVEHEIEDIVKGHPLAETMMDLKNNSEGLRAAKQRRAVNPADLQNRPLAPGAAYARLRQDYDDRSPDAGSYPAGQYSQGTVANGYKDAPRYDPEQRYPPRAYRPLPPYK